MGCSKCRYSDRGCARCVRDFVSNSAARTEGKLGSVQGEREFKRVEREDGGETTEERVAGDERGEETQNEPGVEVWEVAELARGEDAGGEDAQGEKRDDGDGAESGESDEDARGR